MSQAVALCPSRKSHPPQTGAILPIFAVAMVAVLSSVGFAIDYGRGILAHRQASALADAAALAGVQALDKTATGWRNSKRLVLRIIQESSFAEIGRLDGASGYEDGIDPFDNGGSRILVGDLNIEITRGFQSPQRGFIPLEERATVFGVPSYYVANAIHVKVTRSNLSSPFAAALGIFSASGSSRIFGDISSEAYAMIDSEEGTPVAPIAIPACYLFANTDPYVSSKYDSSELDLGKQCDREVIARSVGMHETSNEELSEGMLRASVYPRPPLYPYDDSIVELSFDGNVENHCFNRPVQGLHENCKASPIRAYLGLPGDSSQTITDVDQIMEAFAESSSGSLRTQLGQAFQPADSTTYLEQSFSDLLSELLKATPALPPTAPISVSSIGNYGLKNFREVFYEIGSGGVEIPAKNFPARRNLVSVQPDENGNPSPYTDPFAELRLSWPVVGDSDGAREAILLAPALDTLNPLYPESDRLHFRYTNPMCHSESIPHDDDLNAFVRELNIMIIAPSDEGSRYCDLGALFEHREQEATPPLANTQPVVIGMVKANFFDFRVTPLEGPLNPTPQYPQHVTTPMSSNAGTLIDQSPYAYDSIYQLEELEDLFQEAEDFIEDQSEYVKCRECLSADETGEAPPSCDTYRSGGVFRCEDFLNPIEHSEEQPDWVQQCFSAPTDLPDLVGNLADIDAHSMKQDIIQRGMDNDLRLCVLVSPQQVRVSAAEAGLAKEPTFETNDLTSTVAQSCVPSCLDYCGGSIPAVENQLDYLIPGSLNSVASPTGMFSSASEYVDWAGENLPIGDTPENREQLILLGIYQQLQAGTHWSQAKSDEEIARLTEAEQCANRMFHEIDPRHEVCGMEVIIREVRLKDTGQTTTVRILPWTFLEDDITTDFIHAMLEEDAPWDVVEQACEDNCRSIGYDRDFLWQKTERLNELYDEGMALKEEVEELIQRGEEMMERHGELVKSFEEGMQQLDEGDTSVLPELIDIYNEAILLETVEGPALNELYQEKNVRLEQVATEFEELWNTHPEFSDEALAQQSQCQDACVEGFERLVEESREEFEELGEERAGEIDEIQGDSSLFFTHLNDRYNLDGEKPDEGHVEEEDVSADAINQAVQLALADVGAVEGLHCLPSKKPDAYDLKNPNSWEQPSPKRPGYGCAGLRLRLSCDQQTFMPTAELQRQKPRLIN